MTTRLQPKKLRRQRVMQSMRRCIENGQVRQGEMMPAERKLADLYGVSRVTVRCALEDLETDGVLERIPNRGWMVAQPDTRSTACACIGLVGNRPTAPSGRDVREVRAMDSLLTASGRLLMLMASGLNTQREDLCIRSLASAGAAGLVITPATQGERSRELEAWIRDGRPVVLHGHPGNWLLPDDLAGRACQVDVHNADGVRQVLDHLIGLGHRRIAMVSPSNKVPSERQVAFATICGERGMEVRTDWFVSDVPQMRQGGREALERLRSAGEMPTAVFCSVDELAVGVVAGAREAGFRVPEDLSVVGFGNELMEGPPAGGNILTTVDWSQELVASETIRLLDAQISGVAADPEHVRVPVFLGLRRSTAPPSERS